MGEADWTSFFKPKEQFLESDYPKVSIIVPTYNCAQTIGITLDSLLAQRYPSYEILIIDAGSKDRTLEVVKSARSSLVNSYAVTNYNRYEMLNKGISLARGEYLNFLFPGDYYITNETLHAMMALVLKEKFPALVYCGCLLRDGRSDIKLLYRPLSIELLKQGKQPTNLQSCWFRSAIFRRVGKFDTSFALRGGFDLLCRICLQGDSRVCSTNRILTDYDLNWVTRVKVVRHFWETVQILHAHFGLKVACHYMLHQRDLLRYVKLWMRSFKIALLGGKTPP